MLHYLLYALQHARFAHNADINRYICIVRMMELIIILHYLLYALQHAIFAHNADITLYKISLIC